jgi:hypothetical protein
MPLSFEASTWDETRLRLEITLRLTVGWRFLVTPSEDQTHWVSSIFDDQEVELWSSQGLTLQVALLNLLGWLEIQANPLSDTSPWVRRRGELNPQRVHEIVSQRFPVQEEVPDLDPAEIAAVYSNARKDQ